MRTGNIILYAKSHNIVIDTKFIMDYNILMKIYVKSDGTVLGARDPSSPLKCSINSAGYMAVQCIINGHKKGFLVHRLVALEYIPNPGNKPYVNHKDGNKLNNHYSNLEWVTAKENSDHAIRTGLRDPKKKTPLTLRAGKLVGQSRRGMVLHEVVMTRRLYEYGFKQRELAAMSGLSRNGISDIISGKRYAALTIYTG